MVQQVIKHALLGSVSYSRLCISTIPQSGRAGSAESYPVTASQLYRYTLNNTQAMNTPPAKSRWSVHVKSLKLFYRTRLMQRSGAGIGVETGWVITKLHGIGGVIANSGASPIVADLAVVSGARFTASVQNHRPLNTALSMKWVGMNTSNGYASISSTMYIEPDTNV